MPMRLLRAERLEPKQVFACVDCDPPPRRPRVHRRYRFILVDDSGRERVYCLPCAAEHLGVSQGFLRRIADSSGERDSRTLPGLSGRGRCRSDR
ncbi:hypothetical protein HRbin22_00212 [Candidatus Thermoflexus japonica]|uniref:Uncharacterized protein n=1 Tax=Candidatus Thermoflexus japonica TaxID=2035417 RepID=A0A2H5Y3H6_9CHLR|nr:hypothetical protein HRbin22_00212 [Candidatus Thermoflexus japonica]